MKKIIAKIVSGSAACLFVVATAFAADNDPGIQQREINQQNRINQGVQSGQLTPREAGRLETQQARIQQREERMTARDGGQLTARDKAKLTRQQNKASRNIARKKHNDRMVNVGQ